MKIDDLRHLPPLCFPYADLKLAKEQDGNLRVYDILREKYVVLTPEEFVRQNFVNWLINYLGYPKSLMANEVELKFNELKRRCDTVVMNREFMPLLIVEYKAPNIEITQSTFDQIVGYNRHLKAKYLIVSNGRQNFCCVMDYKRNTYNFVRKIPDYKDAIGMPSIN